MIRAREYVEFDFGGPYSGAAALTRAQALPSAPTPAIVAPELDIVASPDPRVGLRQRLSSQEWTHDLAENIGSRQWFRGLGTMLSLSIAALSFWPDFAPLAAAPAMSIDSAARDEFRSQMIMPLAYGGDSGRRMGATAQVTPLTAAPERPRIALVATMAQGDSFGRMLQRAGVGPRDAAAAEAMIARTLPLSEVRPGTRVSLTLGRRTAPDQPRPLDALDLRARFDLALSLERAGHGALVLERKPIAVDDTPLRIRGMVGSSLSRSARAAGAPVAAIQQYLRTIDGHLSLDSDIEATDRFDIIVAHRRSETGETETGELLYAGLDRGNKPLKQLLRWGGNGQFFEASGIGRQRAGLLTPVAGRITSGFGARRHPILGYTRMHAGIDFGARYGSPIYAVADGAVAFAGRHGGHGNYVRLDHGGGLGTGYGHMSRIAVAPGTRVRTGQVIGYVGSTGMSTGPHLHYELYRNGRAVNPLGVQFAMRAEIDAGELKAFKARLASLKAIGSGIRPTLAAARQGSAARSRIAALDITRPNPS